MFTEIDWNYELLSSLEVKLQIGLVQSPVHRRWSLGLFWYLRILENEENLQRVSTYICDWCHKYGDNAPNVQGKELHFFTEG